jgi:hypothetical protein
MPVKVAAARYSALGLDVPEAPIAAVGSTGVLQNLLNNLLLETYANMGQNLFF